MVGKRGKGCSKLSRRSALPYEGPLCRDVYKNRRYTRSPFDIMLSRLPTLAISRLCTLSAATLIKSLLKFAFTIFVDEPKRYVGSPTTLWFLSSLNAKQKLINFNTTTYILIIFGKDVFFESCGCCWVFPVIEEKIISGFWKESCRETVPLCAIEKQAICSIEVNKLARSPKSVAA